VMGAILDDLQRFTLVGIVTIFLQLDTCMPGIERTTNVLQRNDTGCDPVLFDMLFNERLDVKQRKGKEREQPHHHPSSAVTKAAFFVSSTTTASLPRPETLPTQPFQPVVLQT
jgi:hypothetical protein